MANGKKRSRDSEDEGVDKKKNKKLHRDSINYDFFHDKPESAKKDAPKILVCKDEQFNVFPQILEICASSFSQPQAQPQNHARPQRWTHVEHDNRVYVNLDDLDVRGVQVFANWSMDHEKPVFIAINDKDGDILDDVITCYLTARRLRAYLLCDLILFEACKVGKETDLIVRHAHITKAYDNTTRPEDALRIFLATLVAYKRRNGLANPIAGRDPRPDKERARFKDLPADFGFDLMDELSRNSATQNPCDRPRKFLEVVAYHMQKKEEKKAAAERARLEMRGTRESPLFVDEEDKE